MDYTRFDGYFLGRPALDTLTVLLNPARSFANVLAGTMQRFHADAKFRDAAAAPADIVLVESDAQFL